MCIQQHGNHNIQHPFKSFPACKYAGKYNHNEEKKNQLKPRNGRDDRISKQGH